MKCKSNEGAVFLACIFTIIVTIGALVLSFYIQEFISCITYPASAMSQKYPDFISDLLILVLGAIPFALLMPIVAFGANIKTKETDFSLVIDPESIEETEDGDRVAKACIKRVYVNKFDVINDSIECEIANLKEITQRLNKIKTISHD